MIESEYLAQDGLGLAGLVARGETTPLELVDLAIAQIERQNPALNAVVWTLFEQARERARGPLPAGAFRGVPFLLKDASGEMSGVPTRYGCQLIPPTPASHSDWITERFLAAGLIPLGKTNVPELCILPSTESTLYGPARNPWNPQLISGGSSGGAAAAVASGMVPVAHASDGAGSIRIPAACCGLVGLKPSRARTSFGPDHGEYWGGLVVEHVLSRSVRDSAAMLDAVAGGVAGDPYWAPAGPGSWLAATRQPPAPLRIALVRNRADGSAVHADCLAAVDHAAELCRSLGHRVETVELPPAWSQLVEHLVVILSTSIALQVNELCAAAGAEPTTRHLQGFTVGMAAFGRSLTATQYQQTQNSMHGLTRSLIDWWKSFDLLLTPSLGMPPVPLGSFDPSDTDFSLLVPKLLEFTPFTPPLNATGQPAISLPLHWNAAGLPIGVQFAGLPGREDLLLGLAAQLESADPWAHRRPPVMP